MFGIDEITAPVASAFGAATSFLGGQLTNQANIAQAQANNEWSAQQYATRYQTQVKDLEAAGLNPMLAYMQSPGSAPVAQPVQLTNPYHSAAQTFNETYGSQTRGEHDIASAGVARENQRLVDANVDKVKEEIKNIPLEGRRLERLSALLAEQLNDTFQSVQNKIQTRQVMEATIRKIKSETNLLDLDVDAARQLDNIGRESRQLKPIVDMIRAIIR